jgi:ATP-binding cassette subfamily B protein RaxB
MACIRQTEPAECALACLAMVASHHGRRMDLRTLRRRFSISLKGATLAQLMQMAGALDFASRPLRLELEEIDQLQRPCILHWQFNHFVVLVDVTKRLGKTWVTLLDPARGEVRMELAEVSRHFTGVALELSPTAQFTARDERQHIRMRDLLGRAIGLRRSLGQIILLALALETFALVGPFFMQWVVDGAIVSADRDLLSLLVLGFGLLLVVQTTIALARSWVVLHLSTSLNLQWASNVFGHLLRLPTAYFEKRQLGDIVSRFGSIQSIQRTVTTGAIEAVLDGVLVIAMLVVMLVYSPTLALVVCAAATVYGLLRWGSFAAYRRANEELIVLGAQEQTHFLESVRGVQAIKLGVVEEERRGGWMNLAVDKANRAVTAERMNIGFRTANTALFGLENLIVVWLAAQLVMSNEFSVGMLFAFVAYKQQFTTRVSNLIGLVAEWKMLKLHGERLADIVLEKPEMESGAVTLDQRADSLPAVMEVRDLSYRYADYEPWVLSGLNLRVDAGESLAIVGASGSGKTTLLKLMLGLLPVQEGEVLYGGVPLRQLGPASYRRQIAAVMQDDSVFAGSIADNIALFDARPDLAFVESCARLAGLHDEIARMPMAYHTLVGDMGTALSGGQKQRLMLARALYKRPKILFLDEATSHLDVARERQVVAALKQLKITRVVIAHRPETVAMADRVVKIEGGKIVQELRNVSGPAEAPAAAPAATPEADDARLSLA